MKKLISYLSLVLALHIVSANVHAANRCEDLQNPLDEAGTDANKIGYVIFKQFVPELPILKTLIEADRLPKLSHADFIILKRLAANQIISVSGKPNSALQIFATGL